MLIRNYKILIPICAFLVLPLITFAFPSDLTGVIDMLIDIGLSIIPLLGAIAFLFFVWGVARFIKAAGSEKEIKDSKNLIIWGIIGLFILITIWGIIAFLRSEFGFGSEIPLIPQINFKKP